MWPKPFLNEESHWIFICSVVSLHCSFVPSPNYLCEVTLLNPVLGAGLQLCLRAEETKHSYPVGLCCGFEVCTFLCGHS